MGLDDFYDRAKDTKLNPAKVDLSDLDRFDMEGFKKRYVKEIDGFCSISLIIEGIMSIQAGDNPRNLEAKLLAFLPPKDRVSQFDK